MTAARLADPRLPMAALVVRWVPTVAPAGHLLTAEGAVVARADLAEAVEDTALLRAGVVVTAAVEAEVDTGTANSTLF